MKLPNILSSLSLSRRQTIFGGAAILLAFGGTLALSILTSQKQDGQAGQSGPQVKSPSGNAEEGDSAVVAARLSLPEVALQRLQEDYKKKLGDLKNERRLLDAREERIELSLKSLDEQAQALQDEAVRLEAAEKRVRQKIQDLQNTRIEFTRQEKLAMQKQAEFLEAMAPEQAAAAIEGLLEQGSLKNALLALQSMDSKKAGRALAVMANAKYQALLLEKLPKLQQDPDEQGPP
jgi:hypothetical protein